jgi:hypothetical protein
MNAGEDRELDHWREEWEKDALETPPEIRHAILRRVKRQSRWQRLFVAGEALLAVAMAAMLIGLGARSSHPADLPVVILLLGLIAAALAWGIRSRRGLWRCDGKSATDFLALCLRRVRQRQRMVRGGFVLLTAELAIMVPWIALRFDSPWPVFGFLAGMAAGAIVSLAAVARWSRRDHESLLELKRTLEGNGEG